MANPEERSSHRGLKILLTLIILMILAAGAGGYWYLYMRGVVSSNDARFDGDMVDLAPEISGRLAEVLVREGQRVSKDQVVFTLDKKTLESTLLKARAGLKTAKANLDLARSKYDCAVSGPRLAEIQMAKAQERRLRAQARLEGKTLTLTVSPAFVTMASMHADEYRDLAKKAAGHPMTVEFEAGAAAEEAETETPPSDEEIRRQRLREEAEKEPAVQEALDLFDGRVVDVREAKPSREDE